MGIFFSSFNGLEPLLRFRNFQGIWNTSTLNKLGTFQKGAPLSKADISCGGTPFILYGELYTTYKEITKEVYRKTEKKVDKIYLSKVGDVIIPTSGETPEEIATATCVMLDNVILAGDLLIFRTANVLGQIVSYTINHIVNTQISRIAQGKSVVHIQSSELGKIKIHYPSLPEQEKIAAFLSLVDARIEKQRQLVESLKKYKRGLLSAIFERKLELSSSTWHSVALSKCCNGFDNLRKPISSELREKGTIPYYGANGIQGYVKNYIFDGEYILLAEDGGHFDDFTNSSIAQYITGKSWVNNHAHILQAKPGYNNKYIYYTLVHKDIRKYINGTSRAKLNQEDMWQIKIITPDISTQNKIARFMTAIDEKISQEEYNLFQFYKIKRGLLQQMFI